jgi:hypothetical protein
VRIARILILARAPCLGAGLVSAACADGGSACIEGVELWADRGSDPVCIVGDLVVENRTADELGVLDRVESVTGSVIVHTCPEIETLPVWPLLTRIGGSLSISNNDSLVDVEGFPALEELGGKLYVAENPVLVSVRIGSGVTTVGSVFFALNPSWTDVGGLSSLAEIDGDVKIVENAVLEHLRLPALTRISGDLSLIDNQLLQSLDFPVLEDVGAAISISGNPALSTVEGFPALRAAGHAFINRNDGLRRIIGNPSLEPSIIDALLARVAVDGETRVGDNGGEFTSLDPCPWPDDGICDAEGPYGTELCVSDPEDCG